MKKDELKEKILKNLKNYFPESLIKTEGLLEYVDEFLSEWQNE